MDKYIDISGLKIHYTETGAGAPMVLMHGWGCNTNTLASVQKVAEKSHKVYNIDFPGFGQSDEPTEVWGVERYTDMLREFVQRLSIENPVLLGHSFGGRVGIMYSSQYPVSKLILVDAAGVKPRRHMKYYLKVYTFKVAKRIAPILLGKKRGQALIDRMRGCSGSADYNSSTPMMRAILSRVVNEDLCHLMPRISAPTLLVWGEDDTATPLADAKKMERLIPDAGLVCFQGCGHYSFLDAPGRFAAVLRSFLQS